MSKCCVLTGKKTRSANRVSHANNRNKRKQYPNLVRKKFFLPTLGRIVSLRVSTKALRIINRVGIETLLKETNNPLKPLLLKKMIHKKSAKSYSQKYNTENKDAVQNPADPQNPIEPQPPAEPQTTDKIKQ